MVQRHIERASQQEANATTIEDIRVQNDIVQAKYSNIGWKKLCTFRQLGIHGCSPLYDDDVVYVQSAGNDLRTLATAVKNAYDAERDMWRVHPQTDDEEILESFAIQLETPVSDSVVVQELFDGNEFVADEFESQLRDYGLEVYNLRNEILYVDSLSDSDLYLEQDGELYPLFDEEDDQDERSDHSKLQFGMFILIFLSLVVSPIVMYYSIITGVPIVGVFVIVFSLVCTLLIIPVLAGETQEFERNEQESNSGTAVVVE